MTASQCFTRLGFFSGFIILIWYNMSALTVKCRRFVTPVHYCAKLAKLDVWVQESVHAEFWCAVWLDGTRYIRTAKLWGDGDRV